MSWETKWLKNSRPTLKELARFSEHAAIINEPLQSGCVLVREVVQKGGTDGASRLTACLEGAGQTHLRARPILTMFYDS